MEYLKNRVKELKNHNDQLMEMNELLKEELVSSEQINKAMIGDHSLHTAQLIVFKIKLNHSFQSPHLLLTQTLKPPLSQVFYKWEIIAISYDCRLVGA